MNNINLIKEIKGYQIYDSRGYPTVACKVTLDSNHSGLAFVPSGASTGIKEALELRDNATDWQGKGVNKVVENINKIIAPKVIGLNVFDQEKIDELMIDLDGSDNKANLGANAILAVSLAVCKAAANALGLEVFQYIRNHLYDVEEKDVYYGVLPLVNVINGGQHANNNLDFQEFMFVPLKPKCWKCALKTVSECFLSLQSILKRNKKSIAKGDEGGFSVDFNSIDEVFELLSSAVKEAGYSLGSEVGFAIDVAASEFYDEGYYWLHVNNEVQKLTSDQLMEVYESLMKKYPIVSIEDGFAESDWEAFSKFNAKFGKHLQNVGDDLYCTNPVLLSEGIEKKATNAILIKLNQIGSLTECLRTIKMAQTNKLHTVISHRSGETEDTFIADLAVAVNAKQIKTGSMSRSERLAKYNRLIYINEFEEKLEMPVWKEIIK